MFDLNCSEWATCTFKHFPISFFFAKEVSLLPKCTRSNSKAVRVLGKQTSVETTLLCLLCVVLCVATIIAILNAWPPWCAMSSFFAGYVCFCIPGLCAVALHPWLSLKYCKLNTCQQNRFWFLNIEDIPIVTAYYFHSGRRKEHPVEAQAGTIWCRPISKEQDE